MTEETVVGIVAAPRDAALTESFLRAANIRSRIVADVDALEAALQHAAFAAVVVDEDVIAYSNPKRLAAVLDAQPAWSDLPIVVVRALRPSARTWWRSIERANLTFLERPFDRATMQAAVQTALRARARQHEVRDLVLQLQEDNRLKDLFIAMLGHELRNPLAVITTSAQMLGTNPTRAAHYRALIQRQARHLARVVEDLLDTSRMTQGRLAVELEQVDFADVVSRCMEELEPAAERRTLTLAWVPPRTPVWVHADPVRLEQVLSNLVTNAIKYTPVGGRIDVSLTSDAGQAVLRVRDNGVGIAAELLPRVFELFTQADKSLARSDGGLGMGLALVKNIVELHHGVVSAASPGPGQGTTVEVRLPTIAAPAAAANAGDPEPAVRPLRVVLVEDNPDARALLEEYLTFEGYSVSSAGDGLAGAELIVSSEPDVAVVDIGLPTLDGYGVARFVRSKLKKPVRLLALTGYGQPRDKQRALEAGFDAHMVKPIEPAALSRLLGTLVAA